MKKSNLNSVCKKLEAGNGSVKGMKMLLPVESALVEIIRRDPPDTNTPALFELVKQAFSQRRKMLRKSLSGIVSPEQFEAAAVAPTARPEELDIDAWVRLSNLVTGR